MKKIVMIVIAFVFYANSLFAQTLSLVADINTGSNNSSPYYINTLNNKIYFVAANGTNFKLYSSDGTTSGTQLVGPNTGNGAVWNLTKYNNKLYFTYDDGINGLELWTSDGTSAGTFLLKNIWIGNSSGGIPYSSNPRFFTVCNDLLFFQASTATRQEGLWVTNGTEAGTIMLGNQYSNPFSSTNDFLVFNNKIYFQGNSGSGYGMWSSDGTTAGTQLVKSGQIGTSGGSYAILNNHFYFQNGDNTNGQELWKSDGTSIGTVLVKNINTIGFSSDPQNFFSDTQKVYFSANDGITGRELWSSNGTEAGTQLIKDINIGIGNSITFAGSPNGMVLFNNEVYSFGYNGTSIEFLKTNGTFAETSVIKTISNIVEVSFSYVYNGKIYFGASSSVGSNINSLYVSDGTTSGTNQISPTILVSFTYGNNIVGNNNELYFSANYNGVGYELCKLTGLLSVEKQDFTDKIKVYPNPTNTNITINTNKELLNSTILLTNLQGQTLRQIKLNSISENINISELKLGIYILTIQKENKTFLKKIIKN